MRNTSEPEKEPEKTTTDQADADVRAALQKSAGKTAVGKAAVAETARDAITAATGGWRAQIEAVVPSILFIVSLVITGEVNLSVIAPIGFSVLAILLRFIQKQDVTASFGGLIGVLVAAGLSLWSGQGKNYFVVGLWTSAIFAVVFLISMLVKRPIAGVIVNLLADKPEEESADDVPWFKDRVKFRKALLVTAVWVAMFILRLSVQLPLYLSGEEVALGIWRLALGIPVFIPVVLFSWVVLRSWVESARIKLS
ncbi:MAG: DUF3159 domain-containing protein [Microbacteriaceae bacterium]|nr:DUF3159 domain-containing protein [Microbacteriaceae bacterium]